MGTPLGPLLANVFMCHLEERLCDNDLIPPFYRRYVDDTLAIMPGLDVAESFLDALNGLHPSIHFTMELSNNDSIPFIGMLITKNGNKLETQVYRKPTNMAFYFIFKVTPICATRSVLSKQWFIVQRNCPLHIKHSSMNGGI